MTLKSNHKKRPPTKDGNEVQKRGKIFNGCRSQGNQCQLTTKQDHLVVHTQLEDHNVDLDETQPPSPDSQFMSDESRPALSNENLENMTKKRKGRGSSKCLYVDMHTTDGKKIKIHIPEEIGRAVGKNARNIVNYCGMVVRSDAKLSHKDWPKVKKEVGDIMLEKVKDKFEMDEVDDRLFSSFVFCTMRRLYRIWKCRLHKTWKNLDENEKENYVPKYVDDTDWATITEYWMSSEFKKISDRNKENRAKNTTKHTCGNVAFVEIAEKTKNAVTGEKLTADELWLVQHTKKNDKGEQVWSDPTSEENYYKLKDLVRQQSDGEIPPMTNDEMLIQVLGKTSGYARGKGAGVKAPSSKGTYKNLNVNQMRQEIREELRGEMQEDIEKMVKEKMDEERAKLDEEREKMVQDREEMEKELTTKMGKQLLEMMRAKFSQVILPGSLDSFDSLFD